MDGELKLSFTQHLQELRTRLIYCITASLLCICMSVSWSDTLILLLVSPIAKSGLDFKLIGINPADAFVAKLTVAIYSGLLLSLPIIFYQLWKFIAPGLHKNEKQLTLPFVVVTSLCFICGIFFCYYGVFPVAFRFFIDQFHSINVEPSIHLNEYISFVLKTMFIFGVIFELPVLCFLLVRLGLITSAMLFSNTRWFILGIFIAAAVLTPPDVVSQLVMAVPLLVIYLLCVIIAVVFERKQS